MSNGEKSLLTKHPNPPPAPDAPGSHTLEYLFAEPLTVVRGKQLQECLAIDAGINTMLEVIAPAAQFASEKGELNNVRRDLIFVVLLTFWWKHGTMERGSECEA